MRRRFRHGRVEHPNLSALARELDLPVPFTLDAFRSCLEKHCQRTIHLVGVTMTPGAPSGVWLRSEDSDFLFFEEQTSVFHQAHIVLCLAAHLLANGGLDGGIDQRLVLNVASPPARMIPEVGIGNAVSPAEAEAFAFQVLRRASPYPGYLQANRLLRRLRPLHSELLAAAPSAVLSGAVPGMRTDRRSRLYRVVIEIRDAALFLRPYGAPGMAAAAATHGPVGEVADDELTAAMEAASLVAEANVRAADGRQDSQRPDTAHLFAPHADLCIDAAALAELSETIVQPASDRHRSGSPMPSPPAKDHAVKPKGASDRVNSCSLLDGCSTPNGGLES